MARTALAGAIAAPLLLLAAACAEEQAPVEQVEQAATDLADVVADVPDTSLPPAPYAPQNECGEIAGAAAFLTTLRGAVEGRDADVLLALSADDVKLDFGTGTGKAELRARLDAEGGALWTELEDLMALGCAAEGVARLTLPWYFAQNITSDPYTAMMVTGAQVPLRNAPGTDAPILARISWDLVEALPEQAPIAGFHRVRWENEAGEDLEGYITQSSLRSMIDYRLIAASRNSRWRIVSLVAGD